MNPAPLPSDPSLIEKSFRALRVPQPIGDIYIASIGYELIRVMTYFDVRRVLREDRDVERYLGIQRPLSEKRVAELKKYVKFADATFPTSIIIAIDSDYADYDEESLKLTVRNARRGELVPDIAFRNLARVIDGQHRIEGLDGYNGDAFDIIVSIFVGSDISDQAYVFATVNLEQTKVNISLAYDLYELARTRSPFQTCHNVAVALDRFPSSPFFRKIKRLGVANPERPFETITQATFVNGFIGYISQDPKTDRDLLLRGLSLKKAEGNDLNRTCLRNLFIEGDDVAIGKIIEQYFDAVRRRWPEAWNSAEPGMMLNRTNGFRAFASLFGKVYLSVAKPGELGSATRYAELLNMVKVDSSYFNTDNFKPGTSGESALRKFVYESVFEQELPL
jgi:DGQHR domain-containing protein